MTELDAIRNELRYTISTLRTVSDSVSDPAIKRALLSEIKRLESI